MTTPNALRAPAQPLSFYRAFADFTDAGASLVLTLATPVAGTLLQGVQIECLEKFTGGSVSAATISLGITGDEAKFGTAVGVFGALGTQLSTFVGGYVFDGSTALVAKIIVTGDTLDHLTAGVVRLSAILDNRQGTQAPVTLELKGASISGNGPLDQAVVAGSAAGDITVTGITTTDVLASVWQFTPGTPVFTDLTSEFTITADNTINNTGGTNTTGNQLLVLWNGTVNTGGVRELLTADRTYYVRSDGSDSNNGLTNTAGGAWLTLQYADNFISQNIDFGGFSITVKVGIAGTYVGVMFGSYVGGGSLKWLGDVNPANTPSYIVTECAANFGRQGSFVVGRVSPTVISINGFNCKPSTGNCIYSVHGALVVIGDDDLGGGNIVYTPPAGADYILRGQLIDLVATATIVGGVTISAAIYAESPYATFTDASYTITGTLTCSVAFVWVHGGSLQSFATFSGTVVGQRYFVELNGILDTGGGGANDFPGSLAGASATGGQYV